MIKPGEIQKIASKLGIRDTQIEKDYVIGWVLRGISGITYLKEKLIFKGGTALRKIYLPNYRLSEDLDFTFEGEDYDTAKIKNHFDELIKWIKDESRIALTLQDETVHQTGNYNFYLGYIGPLGGTGSNKTIKVDITNDEKLCNKPVESIVLNEYSDLKDEFKVMSYTLNEIITEKMRSLMQRTIPRDLFDVWHLLEVENKNIEDYVFDFQEKAKFKKLEPDMFVETILKKENIFKKQWETSLVNQIKEIPDFAEVWRTLSKHWRKFEKQIGRKESGSGR